MILKSEKSVQTSLSYRSLSLFGLYHFPPLSFPNFHSFSHSLSPLLDELCCANDVQIVIASLRLLERLLQFAPNRVSRARLRNEMEGLMKIF